MSLSTAPLAKSPPFLGNRRSRLLPRTHLFRYAAIINIMLGAWYLQWRIGHSVNFNALWLAIPLLLAEIYSFLGGVMFTIGLWRPLERQVKSLDQLLPALPASQWPAIDVFVTCYNEPVALVEQTVRAALAIDYPANKLRVYILDDGNSADMRTMSQKLCLEDLQSLRLQAVVQQLKTERSDLAEQLRQLEKLAADAQTAEAQLTHSLDSRQDNPAIQLLQIMQQFFSLNESNSSSVSAQLAAQKREIEKAIAVKELQLAELARCRYIARPKPQGRPHHAKAGNINYALYAGETTGDFILTLDADHIPKPQILKRVLPYFFTYNPWFGNYESNRIALVQTPQTFYNLPKHDPFGHQAHLFYGPIQQGKDGLNAAFYTGTNAVLRREALVNTGLQYFAQAYLQDNSRLDEFDLIGGLSSSSITEDMNTAMRLHAAGWKSIYHHEVLAEGLAPEDLAATLKQRLRWAQGTIQVLRQENPLTKSGLTFWQRLQYFQTMYSYFSGFATVIFIACPIIFFWTGTIPVKAYGADFALHFFPAFLTNRLTFLVAAWGISAREVWRSEQYAVALFPLFIQAVWSVLTKRSIKFQVTPKQRQSGTYLRLTIPQLIVFGLTLSGMVWSFVLFVFGKLNDPGLYLLNAGWAVYNLSLLWGVIQAAIWQPKSKID